MKISYDSNELGKNQSVQKLKVKEILKILEEQNRII